jgi:hypothetical protein
MRKFWQIGLIIVTGLVVVGEARADEAQMLQQEIAGALTNFSASSNKVFTYGDVTVTPDGDSFDVTIDKIAIAPPEVSPVEIGKVGFKLTPEGDDIRNFSDVSLPSEVTFKDPDNKEIKIAIALDHGKGSWSKNLGAVLSADILLRSIEATQPSSDSRALASDVYYRIETKDDGQGIYDQSASIGSKLLTVGDKDGQLAIADFSFSSSVSSAQLGAIMALRSQLQAATKSDKPAEMLPVLEKLFQLFKAVNTKFSLGQISMAMGGKTVFNLKGSSFDFAMQGTDQPKVKIVTSAGYDGLAISDLKSLVGGMGAEIVPSDFGLTVTVNDLPVSAILDSWAKTLPEAKLTDENAAMGTGMMAAGAAMQAIQQAAVKVVISDGKLKAPGLSGSFTGEVTNDPAVPLGFTGSADVELSDLDALIAKGQQYASDPTTAGIIGTLHFIRTLSNRGTNAAGETVDRYKITMDAQGNPLVNGKPLMPPEAPPPADQPSSGDNSSGKSSGSGDDSGATTNP